MSSVQIGQRLLLDTDGLLELLDVLGTPLAESSLSLPVPLLSLLRGRVYLRGISRWSSGPYKQPCIVCGKRGCVRFLGVLDSETGGTQHWLDMDKGTTTYRLASSLPLGSLLRCGVCLAPALVARLGYFSFSIETIGSHWGLFTILPDRIFFVIGRRLV